MHNLVGIHLESNDVIFSYNVIRVENKHYKIINIEENCNKLRHLHVNNIIYLDDVPMYFNLNCVIKNNFIKGDKNDEYWLSFI
jgi:hypothetical protein